MSKKLNIQAVNAAHQADANTKANEVREALRERLANDLSLAQALVAVVGGVRQLLLCGGESVEVDARVGQFRYQLEPTANRYGYTLADHPTRRDLVVVRPLEN